MTRFLSAGNIETSLQAIKAKIALTLGGNRRLIPFLNVIHQNVI